MKRTILVYGVLGGFLVVVLELVEYRFLVVEHSMEIYGGLVALVFSMVGIGLGLRLTKGRERVVVREVPVAIPTTPAGEPFEPDAAEIARLGITPREMEILQHTFG